MTNKNWYVIGLMSGTSLDGVDLVYVKIDLNKGYHFEIFKTKTINYSEKWKIELQEAFGYSGEKLTKINADYGNFLGDLVNEFIDENEIEKLDFIASHGHTIFHNPEQGYTLQIGSGAHLSARCGKKVICDFRSQDVALNGQGAPLVPIGDQLMFSNYETCLNLGGFANISFDDGIHRIAYDICPVNIVMNYFTRLEGMEYDPEGSIASKGKVHEALLSRLNGLDFYAEQKPKSLGFEFVEEKVLPLILSFNLDLKDILRTWVEHCAYQISLELSSIRIQLEMAEIRCLTTGGGAYNNFLISRIMDISEVDLVIPGEEIIDFKEALIFALLGVLKDSGEVNCLKSVTGADCDHSSGVIYTIL